MELYFCTRCGISIPQVEVETGVAGGEDGQYLCSEHRVPPPAPSEDDAATDVELLFCSNCRVSIPMTDARSGRARKQYGSMLCAVCAKADPGERAARREAVEAEMAADVQQNDPLAAVQRPHAALPVGPAPPAPGSSSNFVVHLVLVAGLCLVGGVVAMDKLLEEPPKEPKDFAPDVARLEGQLQSLEDQLADRDREVRKLRGELADAVDKSGSALEGRLGGRIGTLEGSVEGFTREALATDRKLRESVSRNEGALAQLTEQVRALGTDRAAPRPGPDANAGGANGGAVVRPPPPIEQDEPPTVKPPDPKVLELCNELLDPQQEDSVRFPAATELGRLADPAAIPSLAKALLADKHFLVRRACARSLGNLKAWYAAPHLIQALQDKEAYVAQQASYALQTITGQDFGVTQDQALGERKRRARQADKWWQSNKENPPDGVSLQPTES